MIILNYEKFWSLNAAYLILHCTDLRLGHNLALPALKADGEPGPVRGEDGGPHPRVVVAETGLSVVDLEEGQRGFGW